MGFIAWFLYSIVSLTQCVTLRMIRRCVGVCLVYIGCITHVGVCSPLPDVCSGPIAVRSDTPSSTISSLPSKDSSNSGPSSTQDTHPIVTPKGKAVRSSHLPNLDALLKRGYMVVGVCKIDQPPFYQRSADGTLYGHDIELAKNLARSMGIDVVFNEEAENWDGLIDQLIKHDIDLAISFLSKTTQRATKILYSHNYSKVNQTLLLNRLKLAQMLTHGVNTLEKIFSVQANNRLLVYTGSSYIKFARNLFKDVNLVMFKEQSDIINALLTGECVGFITDQLETQNYLDEHPDSKLKLIPIILRENFDMISIGVPSDYKQLLSTVNTFLETNNIFINIDRRTSEAVAADSNTTDKPAKSDPKTKEG